ncbi:MAG TPA: hydrogenase maturation nickel metallochaperone HypA [Bryobacteraceae bacterium]|jgi:hydrogenase nickel incorporation protein HypA/HybF
MHELSIALSILALAEDESKRRGGARVEAIYLKIGVLSGVAKAALLSVFQLATERSEYETCRLVIEDIPISGYCSKCQSEKPIHSLQCLQCTNCGNAISEVLHGRELELSALELV